MKRLPASPVIPDEFLRQRWENDELLQDAHAEMAATSLDDFWRDTPDVTPRTRWDRSAVVDMPPDQDHDRAKAVAIPLPVEIDWFPAIAPRVKLLQNSLPEPTRFLVFPNGRRSLALSRDEHHNVANGSFEPIATRQLRTAEDLGVEQLDVVSTSLGASIGASMLKIMAQSGFLLAGKAGLIEPPNIVGRTPKQVKDAAFKSGLRNLNRAINDSAVPLLSEAQHSRGGRDYVPQLVYMAGLLAPHRVSRSAHIGFTFPFFQRDLSVALERDADMRALVVSGDRSLVSPYYGMEGVRTALAKYDNAAFYEAVGYGHEISDNIVVHAILGKMALDPDTFAKAK